MPLYDFKCKQGHVFDEIRQVGNQGNTKCPDCGSLAEYFPFQIGSCNHVIKWFTAPPGHGGFETRRMDTGEKVQIQPR